MEEQFNFLDECTLPFTLVVANETQMIHFIRCMTLEDDVEKMLKLMRALKSSDQSMIDKFTEHNRGLVYLSFCLKTAIQQIGGFTEEELIGTILEILKNIRLTRFHLDITQLPHLLNELKNKAGIPENFKENIFTFITKWKNIINDWMNRNSKWKDLDYRKFFKEKEEEYKMISFRIETNRSHSHHRDQGKSKRRRSRSVNFLTYLEFKISFKIIQKKKSQKGKQIQKKKENCKVCKFNHCNSKPKWN